MPTRQTELPYPHSARESAPEPQGHGGSAAGTLQRWQAVEVMAREHFQRLVGEIRTPLLETTDLLPGIGEGTDVGQGDVQLSGLGDRPAP